MVVAAAAVAVVAAEVAGLHMVVAAAVVRGAGNIPDLFPDHERCSGMNIAIATTTTLAHDL